MRTTAVTATPDDDGACLLALCTPRSDAAEDSDAALHVAAATPAGASAYTYTVRTESGPLGLVLEWCPDTHECAVEQILDWAQPCIRASVRTGDHLVAWDGRRVRDVLSRTKGGAGVVRHTASPPVVLTFEGPAWLARAT